jgi:hypothetical protein
MFWLLAENTTVISGEWANPQAWVALVQVIGIPAFILFWLGFLLYRVAGWIFGADGWGKKAADRVADSFASVANKVEECLPKLETALSAGATRSESQLKFCEKIHEPGGEANVSDLRAAGHSAANALRDIGNKVGADVSQHVDEIHRILDGKIK